MSTTTTGATTNATTTAKQPRPSPYGVPGDDSSYHHPSVAPSPTSRPATSDEANHKFDPTSDTVDIRIRLLQAQYCATVAHQRTLTSYHAMQTAWQEMSSAWHAMLASQRSVSIDSRRMGSRGSIVLPDHFAARQASRLLMRNNDITLKATEKAIEEGEKNVVELRRGMDFTREMGFKSAITDEKGRMECERDIAFCLQMVGGYKEGAEMSDEKKGEYEREMEGFKRWKERYEDHAEEVYKDMFRAVVGMG